MIFTAKHEIPFKILQMDHFHLNSLVLFLQLFQRIISEDKRRNGGHLNDFLMGPSIDVRIRRNSLYQDAFNELGSDQSK